MKVLSLLLFSLILSFMISISASEVKKQNDLLVYGSHYTCLKYDVSSISECSFILGRPFDFGYEYIAYFSKIFLGIDNFYWFLFFILFFSFFSVNYFVYKISPLFTVSLLFLISDFRFWEYGSGLRLGLAIAIFMPIFYFLLNRKLFSRWMILIKFIPMFLHASAIFLSFTRKKKYSLFLLLLGLIFAMMFTIYFDDFFSNIASIILPKSIYDKVYFYNDLTKETGGSFKIPVHYLIIIIIGWISIWRRWINNDAYIYVFNTVFVLLIFGISLYPIGMGYRLFSFMMPFLAILFSYQVKFVLEKLSDNTMLKGIVILMVSTLFLFIFYRNFEFIVRGV